MKSSPTIWALTGDKAGTIAQALGLARQIAALSGGKVTHKTITTPALSAYLPSFFTAFTSFPIIDLGEEKPDILIGCGTKAQAALLALGKRFGAFTVCVQRPYTSENKFDAVVAPRHDYPENANEKNARDANIFLISGATGLIGPEMLSERCSAAKERFAAYRSPLIAALIGGENRAYLPDVAKIISQLQSVQRVTNGGLLVTTSRRSGTKMRSALENAFAASHFVWDGNGENPYTDILAAADAVLVTEDSVNMISEACATGRAVYLLPLSVKKGWRACRAARKFSRFHIDMIEREHARRWSGEWSFCASPPLDETTRAARMILEYRQKMS